MSDNNQTNLTNPDFWIRLLYMLLFCILATVARIVIIVIAVLQAILVLVTREANSNLQTLGDSIAQWTQQAYRFLAFASDEKPFPFQDWPVGQVDVPESEPDTPAESAGSQADNAAASGASHDDAKAVTTGEQSDTADAEEGKGKES